MYGRKWGRSRRGLGFAEAGLGRGEVGGTVEAGESIIWVGGEKRRLGVEV